MGARAELCLGIDGVGWERVGRVGKVGTLCPGCAENKGWGQEVLGHARCEPGGGGGGGGGC